MKNFSQKGLQYKIFVLPLQCNKEKKNGCKKFFEILIQGNFAKVQREQIT